MCGEERAILGPSIIAHNSTYPVCFWSSVSQWSHFIMTSNFFFRLVCKEHLPATVYQDITVDFTSISSLHNESGNADILFCLP